MVLKGGPTQDEILAVSLFKLGIEQGERVADIGCGTGKVSVAMASQAEEVVAIDHRSEAYCCAKTTFEQTGFRNIILIKGEALEVLPDHLPIQKAFIGGSQDLEEIIELLHSSGTTRIVVNAVLLETMQRTIRIMKNLGIFKELVQITVNRSHELAGCLQLRPINPVFIITGGKN